MTFLRWTFLRAVCHRGYVLTSGLYFVVVAHLSAAQLVLLGAVMALTLLLSDIPAGLVEDVVRGKIRLAGGGALLPGLAARIETAAGIGAVLVEDPLRCVVRGAAEMLERSGKDKGKQAGPGLRQ